MANVDNSFNEAVSGWIDQHAWPRTTSVAVQQDKNEARSILILTRIANNREIFEFKCARGYFEVTAIYHPLTNSLSPLQVAIIVPGYPSGVVLASARPYTLSTNPGEALRIDIGNDRVRIQGTVSFKFQVRGIRPDIVMEYSLRLPFAGNQEGTISIAPTSLSLFFTVEELKAIPALTSSALQLETEKIAAFHASESTAGETQVSTLSFSDSAEQKLLIKFLDDFAKDGDKIIIETYYSKKSGDDGSTLQSQVADGSKSYDVSIGFLGIFELIGSIDPAELQISSGLFVKVPIAGRVCITNMQGSLVSEAGVVSDVNAVVAKGTVKLAAKANGSGKHDLFVDLTLSVKFVGDISSGGPLRLLTLPF